VRRLVVLVAAILAATTGTAVAVPASSSSGHDTLRNPIGAFFASSCGFSHRAPDDPIVFPGRPGWSHDHTFVGNASTSAFSTPGSLRSAHTTCQRPGDTAAYWAPTLFAGSTAIVPLGATIYYRRLTKARVRPFPPGLRMVAGNSLAGRPQPARVTYWQCSLSKTDFNYAGPMLRRGGDPPETYGGGIPRCGRSANLELRVNFPDCWNGRSLDSRTHKSHMAYSVAGRCPGAHPIAVPALSLVYRYPPPDAATLTLSSGGQYSGHADFLNAWNQAALTRLVDTCLNAGRRCGLGS